MDLCMTKLYIKTHYAEMCKSKYIMYKQSLQFVMVCQLCLLPFLVVNSGI